MGPATPSRLALNEASWSGTARSAGYEWISEPAARGYDRLTPACPNNLERQKRLLHHLIRVELSDGRVERTRANLSIELGDFEVNLIFQIQEIELSSAWIEHGDFFACIKSDSRLCQSGGDSARRTVVDQVAVDHRLPIR